MFNYRIVFLPAKMRKEKTETKPDLLMPPHLLIIEVVNYFQGK